MKNDILFSRGGRGGVLWYVIERAGHPLNSVIEVVKILFNVCCMTGGVLHKCFIVNK